MEILAMCILQHKRTFSNIHTYVTNMERNLQHILLYDSSVFFFDRLNCDL